MYWPAHAWFVTYVRRDAGSFLFVQPVSGEVPSHTRSIHRFTYFSSVRPVSNASRSFRTYSNSPQAG